MERALAYGVLAPPTILIALSLLGALLAPRWPRTGIGLAAASSLCLFVAATPVVATGLLSWIEAGLPPDTDFSAAQAIVVLGGDIQHGNGRDRPDTLGVLSLERVVLAAQAYRRLHLPVAVSGGRVGRSRESEGALMREALERDFAVPVAWNEDQSRTTWQNALFTARLLRKAQVATVIVVTQAWHLPRALWSFERAGIKALPWPAPRTNRRYRRFDAYLPSIDALHKTTFALHELIGLAYYRLRH